MRFECRSNHSNWVRFSNKQFIIMRELMVNKGAGVAVQCSTGSTHLVDNGSGLPDWARHLQFKKFNHLNIKDFLD